jgi:hypothetical protein
VVLSRAFEPPDLLVATVTGLVTSRDQATLVEWVRDTLRTLAQVRLLVVLHQFEGWKPEAPFTDISLWLQDHERVSRMAIVGKPAWRRATLTFIAQPSRRLPIEYFVNEAAARQWLGAETACA